MPYKKELRHHYGPEWRRLSKRLRNERANNCCEWCSAQNYQPHPITKSKVILTCAHLNQVPGDNREENLAVLCQRCHLKLDRDQHKENAKATRQTKKDQARPLLAQTASR